VAGSAAIAQGAVGNGVLPSAQCRFSNPASTVIPGRVEDANPESITVSAPD
jgi:hypothetical protein